MYKWLEDRLGITKLKGRIVDLQAVIDNQDSEIKSYLNDIQRHKYLLGNQARRLSELNTIKDRAIKAEQALAPTKKSLEVLTAERSKWQRKIKRLENKR